MVSLLGHEVRALIGPRAIHSFISYQVACKLQLQYEDMHSRLCVRTPLGKNVIVNQECRASMIEIGGIQLRVDLMVIPL